MTARFARFFSAALIVATAAGCVDAPTEHRVRANAYLRAGDADKALGEIAAGLEQRPRDLPLLILQGKALFELTRYREALDAFGRAIALGGDERALREARLGFAMAALRLGQAQQARGQLDRLVAADPSEPEAQLNLARVCLELKDFDCAIAHGETAGHLRGRSEEVLFTLGRIYLAAGKLDDAGKTFAHICEAVPNAASCPYGIALVLAQRGDKDGALAKLREALLRKLPSPDKLAADPLLAPLAGDPRFSELCAQAKK